MCSAERELRNETRKNGWDSSQQMEQTMRGLNLGDKSQQRGSGKSSAAEKSKYVFLDEDDDENNQALEDEATIDRQMDELSGAVSVLNRVAKAQTQTVQRQIVTADRINEKVSRFAVGRCRVHTLANTVCRRTWWTMVSGSTGPVSTASNRLFREMGGSIA